MKQNCYKEIVSSKRHINKKAFDSNLPDSLLVSFFKIYGERERERQREGKIFHLLKD